MPVRSSYPVGMPCWIDCITGDVAASTAFYGALFGWTFADEGRDHHLVLRDGAVVGGLGAAPPDRPGPAFWTTYLASKDLPATVIAVRANGGQIVMPPMPAGPNGQLCLALDPSGAAVGFWQGARADGIVLVDEPGAMVWHELRTPSAAVLSFYSRLFPLSAEPDGAAVRVRLGDEPAFSIHECAGAARWIPQFGAESPDELAERAVALGASRVPGDAVVLRDPAGATFGVIKVRDAPRG